MRWPSHHLLCHGRAVSAAAALACACFCGRAADSASFATSWCAAPARILLRNEAHGGKRARRAAAPNAGVASGSASVTTHVTLGGSAPPSAQGLPHAVRRDGLRPLPAASAQQVSAARLCAFGQGGGGGGGGGGKECVGASSLLTAPGPVPAPAGGGSGARGRGSACSTGGHHAPRRGWRGCRLRERSCCLPRLLGAHRPRLRPACLVLVCSRARAHAARSTRWRARCARASASRCATPGRPCACTTCSTRCALR